MKTIYLAIFTFFITSYAFSQTNNDCGWEVINTASNAVIAIQQENAANYTLVWLGPGVPVTIQQMSQFNCPATLGVFYTDDNGDLQCGGMTQWDNTQNMAIAAWGDDSTTPEKDGFASNEPYTFKLCVDGLGELINSFADMSTDAPFSASYSNNGFGSINSIYFDLTQYYFNTDWENWALEQNCDDGILDLENNNSIKQLMKTVDIYGRDIISTNQKGILINIYSDLTTSKFYQF